jgi:hypothetical protein
VAATAAARKGTLLWDYIDLFWELVVVVGFAVPGCLVTVAGHCCSCGYCGSTIDDDARGADLKDLSPVLLSWRNPLILSKAA